MNLIRFCKRGHEVAGLNAKYAPAFYKGKKYEHWDCRICQRLTAKKRRAKKRKVTIIISICPYCSSEFKQIRPNPGPLRKTCSRKCYRRFDGRARRSRDIEKRREYSRQWAKIKYWKNPSLAVKRVKDYYDRNREKMKFHDRIARSKRVKKLTSSYVRMLLNQQGIPVSNSSIAYKRKEIRLWRGEISVD